jgi:hypothetical protein
MDINDFQADSRGYDTYRSAHYFLAAYMQVSDVPILDNHRPLLRVCSFSNPPTCKRLGMERWWRTGRRRERHAILDVQGGVFSRLGPSHGDVVLG